MPLFRFIVILVYIIVAFWKQNGQHTLLLVNYCGINYVMLYWVQRILDGLPKDMRLENCRYPRKVVSTFVSNVANCMTYK